MNKVILMGRLTRDPETRYSETEAMKGEVKQNTAENVEEWLKLYESSKKRQARG